MKLANDRKVWENEYMGPDTWQVDVLDAHGVSDHAVREFVAENAFCYAGGAQIVRAEAGVVTVKYYA